MSFCSVRTAEWCLPLIHLDDALAMVIQLAQDYASKHRQYSLLPIYVRLVKTDDLFMSPASKFRPDGSSISEENCYIEVREIICSVHSVGAFVWNQSGIRIIRIMRVSFCLGAILIPE